VLLIANGQVLEPGQARPVAGDVLVEGERIIAVGPHLAAPPDAARLDATGKLVLPGLINAHTHANHSLIKGVADRLTLELLLNAGPALYLNRTVEEHYLSALLGAVEMLKTGTTGTYDLFLALPGPSLESIEAVVRAYSDAGLRAVVAPSAGDLLFHETVPGLTQAMPEPLRSDIARRRPAPGPSLLAPIREGLRRYHGLGEGRVRLAVAPTIPGHCTDAFLLECARLAEEFGVGVHTHLAESKVQALSGRQRYGVSVTRHLHDLGVLGPTLCVAHAVWVDGDDIGLLADAGTSVVHNPASNMKLGSGIAPIAEMRARGVSTALGTDGSASSDNQNMFEALRFAALLSKVRSPDYPTWLTAGDVLKMATTEGARALGFGDRLGRVMPGCLADLVLVRLDSVYLRPLNHLTHQLVYCETGGAVDTVLVGGRMVVQGGQVLTVDEAALRDKAQVAADRLREANRGEWESANRLAPIVAGVCGALARQPYHIHRYGAADWMPAA
jgi:5-methylthioadenosine/S-adenosylhomocysteine deaminase